MANNIISITDLSKSFGNIKAVNRLSFSSHQSEVIALLGPNGAGKSTLMNMITGFLSPDCGQITIFDSDSSNSPLQCKNYIGFLPEGSPLYYDMTVNRFLQYIGSLKGIKSSRLKEVIDLAQIGDVLTQKNETLSKGYQRRVGFAQSILSDPPILLLDEPTDGLDPNQKEHIQKLIRQMGKNKTIIVSTHLLDEAEAIADRIIIMDRGTIKIDGSLNFILNLTSSGSLAEAFKKLTANPQR